MSKISDVVVKILRTQTENEFKRLNGNKNYTYDQLNAFQHSYTSGYLSIIAGEDNALYWGYQKEISTKDIETARDLNIGYLDTNRDLWNNQKGIEYAKKYPNNKKLAEEIYKNIMDSDNPDFIIDKNDTRRWNQNSTPENLWDIIAKEQQILNTGIQLPKKNTFDDGYFKNFHKAQGSGNKPTDPIIFDLNNDGLLETTDINNGIYFDHENDGFAEASAWVGNNDGILVVDSNNNDEIDNGTELLTAETIVSFDTNNDGVIDENDTNFANLKILKGDGTLLTLSEAGITSININTTLTDITDENGNQQFASGTFTRADGTTGTFGEFLVNTDTSDSIAAEWLEETDEISEMPDIDGSGTVYSLHQAMLRDTSGELKILFNNSQQKLMITLDNNLLNKY